MQRILSGRGQSEFSFNDYLRLLRGCRRSRAAEETRLAEAGLTREEATNEYLEGRLSLEDYIALSLGE